jgi:hypothetical protein
MSDSEIIWKFLRKEFIDEHPVIYLYVTNRPRSSKNALDRAVDETKLIFGGVYPDSLIKPVVERFLQSKRKEYMCRKIQVKPIY